LLIISQNDQSFFSFFVGPKEKMQEVTVMFTCRPFTVSPFLFCFPRLLKGTTLSVASALPFLDSSFPFATWIEVFSPAFSSAEA